MSLSCRQLAARDSEDLGTGAKEIHLHYIQITSYTLMAYWLEQNNCMLPKVGAASKYTHHMSLIESTIRADRQSD